LVNITSSHASEYRYGTQKLPETGTASSGMSHPAWQALPL
jgi:hypothetical protein